MVDPIRVLIADDEPALRLALADLLAHEDRVALVGTAGDADEAIDLAGRLRPEVALVDVKMPGGGGPHAARGIVSTSPDTRVIALSAFEDRPTVLEMLRAGAVGYLVKGTAADEIVSSIARVADGGTSLSDEVIGGLVDELTSQLRREEHERADRQQRREAVERFVSGDGLAIAYQPILELRSRDVVGYEALARFRSLPERPPDEWFAEAVELELGVQLELTAIRHALRGLERIPPHAYLSVNASHRAASSPRLREVLGPHAHRVMVEITEHERISDYSRLAAALAALRERGARIAIDDAGAGFASLRHTLQLAPDVVKVDISLTRSIDADRARRAMASALISFADEMGMTIVAEGIETQRELDTLLELGVRFGQGFFLAEPGSLR
jgi:EAL domain-containing protein (putative c-di-GMP-specific phosphodiesterase class I)/CheY-like chemotaxis protein